MNAALVNAEGDPQVSEIQVFVDATQDILQNKNLQVSVSAVPVGKSDRIALTLGFVNQIT